VRRDSEKDSREREIPCSLLRVIFLGFSALRT
jgi:hypothetical protein